MTLDKATDQSGMHHVLILSVQALEEHYQPLKQLLFPLFSRREREKVEKYRVANAAVNSMAGKYLLLKGLQHFNLSPPLYLTDLDYTKFKRPIISPKVDFNISHSGNMVSCALCKTCTIGYDIEEIKPHSLSDFHIVFTPEETQEIKNAESPIQMFYRYWTQKEAVMKGDGRGFYLPPKDIRLSDNLAFAEKETWHLHKIDIHPNFAAHLAVQTPDSLNIDIRKVEFEFEQV